MQYTEEIYFTLSSLHIYKRSQSSLAWLPLGIRMAVTLSVHIGWFIWSGNKIENLQCINGADSVTFDITEKKIKSLAYLPIGNRIAMTHGLTVGACLIPVCYSYMYISWGLLLLQNQGCLWFKVTLYQLCSKVNMKKWDS